MRNIPVTKLLAGAGAIFLAAGALIAGAYASQKDSFSSVIDVATQSDAVPIIVGEVINTYPHDKRAYTQGLFFDKGEFFETTGIRRKSELRKVNLETGEVLARERYPDYLFGEGAVVWGDKIIGLTWQSGLGLIFDRETLKGETVFGYEGEGWGLTHNGKHLIVSNGSDELQFWDPETRSVVARKKVTLGGKPVWLLNELEWIEGELFANVLREDVVLRIDIETGHVTSIIDFRHLREKPLSLRKGPEVLNGIAYNPDTNKLYVTGKRWPALYEISTENLGLNHKVAKPNNRSDTD